MSRGSRATAAVAAAGGAAAGAVAVGRVRRARRRGRQDGQRWQVMTVFVDAERAAPGGRLPEPLTALGDRIETQVRPAADGKGTEVAARLRDASAGTAQRAELRAALRRSKQLVEVGEVLANDPVPHGRRTKTPGGLLLEAVTRRADRGGWL